MMKYVLSDSDAGLHCANLVRWLRRMQSTLVFSSVPETLAFALNSTTVKQAAPTSGTMDLAKDLTWSD